MAQRYPFHDIGRLPAPGDNVAIATRNIPAGTEIDANGRHLRVHDTLLEGHRFAIEPISSGAPLLSWGLPFGFATEDIQPGAYVCNARILAALQSRKVDFVLPSRANFADKIAPYVLDETTFKPGVQVPRYATTRTFLGYPRPAGRGVGTRNDILILGTTSRTASYARVLEARLKALPATYDRIDDIVAVAHTEGGGSSQPNNQELLLRILSGFMVHPNVGAVLVVDYGTEPVNNAQLRDYLIQHAYPLHNVRHRFLTLSGDFQADLAQGAAIIAAWLPEVNTATRCVQPLDDLKVALQCGGSDAFSGISGNPLAAWVAKEIIRYGGSANLAETDELIGAEAYVLQNVRDLDTARAFLTAVERFKERVAWHGGTAEGNPSGGNMFRGLYNIVLKSLGAAMKRHPDVRLDYVIPYGQRMRQPGFYFMDSPGNDLESIAGQVAAGSNLIFFITGNGSITNFPFVPTIKFLTTTTRYQMLEHDMDVNAGAYLDGTPLAELGHNTLDLALSVASGERSVGEKAAHAQVSIWRDWPQRNADNLQRLQHVPLPLGQPLATKTAVPAPSYTFQAIRTSHGHTLEQIGLILPTSLCSAQIAHLIATRLNNRGGVRNHPLSRFVALPHTEGCGVAGAETLYTRTLLGYLTHPRVQYGLLLEHGCEKTHNDYMAHQLARMGLDAQQFGWASIQMDGGIARVTEKVEAWFDTMLTSTPPLVYDSVGLSALRLGLITSDGIAPEVAGSLARLTTTLVGAGGTVVIPANTALLDSGVYRQEALTEPVVGATLAYGQQAAPAGLHVMETPTAHWVETLTGMGATGIDLILAYVTEHPMQTHAMIPTLQITTMADASSRFPNAVDVILPSDHATWLETILRALVTVADHTYTPKLYAQGNTDFQITRGLLGVSM